jgi:MFS family permease
MPRGQNMRRENPAKDAPVMANTAAGTTPTPVPFYRRPSYKWAVVAMLWWLCFFNYADRQAIFSLFPLLEKEMHLTPIELGWLGSSFALVYGLLAPFAGNVGDRFRRKNVIIWGLYIWSIICLFTGLARKFGQLLFFRAAEGMGETFYFPATTSLLSDYHGKRTRSRALGLHNTGVYVGTIAGGFFAGLIGQHYGWRLSFYVFGSLGIILGLAIMWFIVEPARGAAERVELGVAEPEARSETAPTGGGLASVIGAMLTYVAIVAAGAYGGYSLALAVGFRALWASIPAGAVLGALPGIAVGLYAAMYVAHGRSGVEFLRWVVGTPTVLVLMLVFMLANAVALVPLSWMPKFVFDKFHLPLALAALGATFPIQVATMVGAPMGGWFADLLRRRTPGGRMIVQALALIVGAPFVYLAGTAPVFWGLMAALVFWGLLKGMYDANIFASAFDVVPPRFRGTAAGFMNMAGWLGGFPAPIIIGYIAEQRSLSVAIASASVVYVVAGIIMLAGVAAFARRDAARMERSLLDMRS